MTLTSYGQAGGVESLPNYVEDDWGDDALTGRSNVNTGIYQEQLSGGVGDLLKGIYRPEWTTESGSPSATGGVLDFPAGDTTQQIVVTPESKSVGTWKIDQQFNTTPSAGTVDISFLAKTLSTSSGDTRSNNSYYFHHNSNSDIKLGYESADTSTNIITAAITDGTSLHTAKWTRDEDGNFELFWDGTSQGTASDTTYTTGLYYMIGSNMDVSVDHDNFKSY